MVAEVCHKILHAVQCDSHKEIIFCIDTRRADVKNNNNTDEVEKLLQEIETNTTFIPIDVNVQRNEIYSLLLWTMLVLIYLFILSCSYRFHHFLPALKMWKNLRFSFDDTFFFLHIALALQFIYLVTENKNKSAKFLIFVVAHFLVSFRLTINISLKRCQNSSLRNQKLFRMPVYVVLKTNLSEKRRRREKFFDIFSFIL